jgi:hypothetical protein
MICRHSSMPVLRGRLMTLPEADVIRGWDALGAAILQLIALRSVCRAASASPCRNLHFDANLQEPSACQFLQGCSNFIFFFLFLFLFLFFYTCKSAAHCDSKQAVSNKLLAGRHVGLQAGGARLLRAWQRCSGAGASVRLGGKPITEEGEIQPFCCVEC